MTAASPAQGRQRIDLGVVLAILEGRRVAGGLTFFDVLTECIGNRELVGEFDRLSGSNLSGRGAPIERMIDEATGRNDADLAAFVNFVFECVFIRLEPAPAPPTETPETL